MAADGKNSNRWSHTSPTGTEASNPFPPPARLWRATASGLPCVHTVRGAYNLGNFMQTLATPNAAKPWSLTNLRQKLMKIGAKMVSHDRYVLVPMAAAAKPLIAGGRPGHGG